MNYSPLNNSPFLLASLFLIQSARWKLENSITPEHESQLVHVLAMQYAEARIAGMGNLGGDA